MNNENLALAGLNEQQYQAATTLQGNIRLIAGAGTGKTSTLTKRIAYIVSKGISPERILSVTFTNKAAAEMRERAAQLLGVPENTLPMQTFHSLCSEILREDIKYLGWSSRFNLGTDTIFKSIVRDIIDTNGGDQLDADTYNYLLKRFLGYIDSMRRNTEEDYVTYLVDSPLPTLPTLQEVLAYENQKAKDKKEGIAHVRDINEKSPTNKYVCHIFAYQKRLNYLSFDDLIRMTCYLFKRYPNVLKKWQNKFDYIQCDEFQDTEYYQFSLLEMLSKSHGNLFVVGDPDQSIYGFRGAKPEILTHLDEKLPNVQTIIMDKNYRSKGEILDVGNTIIRNCPDRIPKDLQAMNGYCGDKVEVLYHKNGSEVSQNIVKLITQYINKGYSYKDIALLYRSKTSSHVSEIVRSLKEADLPYIIWDSKDTLESMQFLCLQTLLEIIINPTNTIALTQLLENIQGIENLSEINTLVKHLGETMTMPEVFIHLQENKLFNVLSSNRVESVAAFFKAYIPTLNGSAQEFICALSNVLETLFTEDTSPVMDLFSQTLYQTFKPLDSIALDGMCRVLEQILLDNCDTSATMDIDAVQLMTMHKSKGLEFPIVFCLDVNYKVFPSYRVMDMPEEFRIAYVAYTRAKEKLFICTSAEPVTKKAFKRPSVLVTQIEEEYLVLPETLSPDWLNWKTSNFNEIEEKLKSKE